MTTTEAMQAEQTALWNGVAGATWTDEQAMLDGMFQPFEAMLAEGTGIAPGMRVLDVGCGTGAVTLACARRSGSATGIDISEAMIALARQRAEAEGLDARFLPGDAGTLDLARGGFDRLVSRFGVMFFADPVAVFTRLRGAMAADGEMHVMVWRAPEENDFMTTADRAAAPLLPDMPPRVPGQPGQFAFADRDRVAGLLGDAGWRDVDFAPVDAECVLPAAKLPDYYRRMGPIGAMLQGMEAEAAAPILARLGDAFARFVEGDVATFTAACWSVRARA